ncbi:hypothetical protein HHK36_006383 [Tetracentron sinense]|uniref:Uncharacterized protein n=1 Tax=Tetracentron sinense TaxID=13715 RepID=A0A834ZPH9_TETSI|nr:hypothetical protein HHK36_006383 [Tetracentron sinense]
MATVKDHCKVLTKGHLILGFANYQVKTSLGQKFYEDLEVQAVFLHGVNLESLLNQLEDQGSLFLEEEKGKQFRLCSSLPLAPFRSSSPASQTGIVSAPQIQFIYIDAYVGSPVQSPFEPPLAVICSEEIVLGHLLSPASRIFPVPRKCSAELSGSEQAQVDRLLEREEEYFVWKGSELSALTSWLSQAEFASSPETVLSSANVDSSALVASPEPKHVPGKGKEVSRGFGECKVPAIESSFFAYGMVVTLQDSALGGAQVALPMIDDVHLPRDMTSSKGWADHEVVDWGGLALTNARIREEGLEANVIFVQGEVERLTGEMTESKSHTRSLHDLVMKLKKDLEELNDELQCQYQVELEAILESDREETRHLHLEELWSQVLLRPETSPGVFDASSSVVPQVPSPVVGSIFPPPDTSVVSEQPLLQAGEVDLAPLTVETELGECVAEVTVVGGDISLQVEETELEVMESSLV